MPALLNGTEAVSGQRVEARGIVGSFRASLRGDFEPAPGAGHALDTYRQLSRSRSRWFRAVNAGAAVVDGLVVWALVEWRGDMPGWRFVLFLALCGLGPANALWDMRPPRRRKDSAREAVAQGPPPSG